MNIGDYVRTKNGISKIVAFYSNAIFNDKNKRIENNSIIKSSPNIIDLIKVGDYVNGIYIDENNGKYLETLEHDMENSSLGHIEYYKIWDYDIKTVITKEQIEQMEYKL